MMDRPELAPTAPPPPPVPTLVAAGTTARDAPAAATTLNFVVIRGGVLDRPTTVDYRTEDGTAKAGVHYLAAAGTLAFAAGEASRLVPVAVAPHPGPHSPRDLALALSNPANGTLLTPRARGIIESGVGEPPAPPIPPPTPPPPRPAPPTPPPTPPSSSAR